MTYWGRKWCKHVKTLVLTGATAPKIKASVQSAPGYGPQTPSIIEADDFYSAIEAAKAAAAQPGDIVLLSPASASSDHFKIFMVRGNEFKKKVMEL